MARIWTELENMRESIRYIYSLILLGLTLSVLTMISLAADKEFNYQRLVGGSFIFYLAALPSAYFLATGIKWDWWFLALSLVVMAFVFYLFVINLPGEGGKPKQTSGGQGTRRSKVSQP